HPGHPGIDEDGDRGTRGRLRHDDPPARRGGGYRPGGRPHRRDRVAAAPPGAQSVTRPCLVQWLDQPPGVTFTTVRRPQRAQYRGGSSFLAARQDSCTPPPEGSWRPQCSPYPPPPPRPPRPPLVPPPPPHRPPP